MKNLRACAHASIRRNNLRCTTGKRTTELQGVEASDRHRFVGAITTANDFGGSLRDRSGISDDMQRPHGYLLQDASIDRFRAAASEIMKEFFAVETAKYLMRRPTGDCDGIFSFRERRKCLRIRFNDVELDQRRGIPKNHCLTTIGPVFVLDLLCRHRHSAGAVFFPQLCQLR